MDIRDTKSVTGVAGVRRAEARKRSPSDGPRLEPNEVVSISGIPEAELTPRVRKAILRLMHEVQQLRHELDDSRARIAYLERLADEDALTPIANRRAFVRELSRMMAFSQRYGTSASIVYLDLNGLKRINDELGHAAGDAVLRHVAQTLIESVRNTDVVGRLGGDEFGVILVQTDEETARKKAEALAATIAARPLSWEGREIPLSAAIGTYSFRGEENPAAAIDAADRAMYARKREGK